MARNYLSLVKKFSIRWRALSRLRSYFRGERQLDLGGITTVLPAAVNGSMTRLSASKALSAISASACMSGSRWAAPTRSCASPPVRWKPIGLPSAVDEGMDDLGAQAAARAANGLVF